ncbi:MAG: DUF1700 domain-containing protein [Hungatella sp.]
MSKETFMKELEYLLQDIPEEDKADALAYYRDYLEEAGAEAEQAIAEFGSPERIAAIIRSDIAGHIEDGGEFTERGFEDERFRDPNYQVAKRYDLPEVGAWTTSDRTAAGTSEQVDPKTETTAPRTSKVLKVVLWSILILVASPLLLGVGGSALGILAALLSILLCCVIVVGVMTLAFFVSGIVAGVMGVIYLAVNPLGALLTIGIACLMLGLAFLFLVLGVQFYGRFLPWLIRGTVDLFSRLIHRKGGTK